MQFKSLTWLLEKPEWRREKWRTRDCHTTIPHGVGGHFLIFVLPLCLFLSPFLTVSPWQVHVHFGKLKKRKKNHGYELHRIKAAQGCHNGKTLETVAAMAGAVWRKELASMISGAVLLLGALSFPRYTSIAQLQE